MTRDAAHAALTHKANKEASMLHPIKPAAVRNALIAALANQGVSVTVDQMDGAITNAHQFYDSEPAPEGTPSEFTFCGVVLTWPMGRETRALTGQERAVINAALRMNNNHANLMEPEDTVRVARHAYIALHQRMTHHPELLPMLQPLSPEVIEVIAHDEREQALTVIEHVAPVLDDGVFDAVTPQVAHLDSLLATLREISTIKENA